MPSSFIFQSQANYYLLYVNHLPPPPYIPPYIPPSLPPFIYPSLPPFIYPSLPLSHHVHRCLFASNFPVDRINGTFSQLMDTLSVILGTHSTEQTQKFLSGNAKSFYHLQTWIISCLYIQRILASNTTLTTTRKRWACASERYNIMVHLFAETHTYGGSERRRKV